MLAGQCRDGRRIRGVHPGRHEAGVAVEAGDGTFRARGVVVGHDDLLVERAARRDRDDGAADASGADDEDAHRAQRALNPAGIAIRSVP